MSRESVDTVQLKRYAATKDNGHIEKDIFISGEQYVYDSDGYVLSRDDVDENGNIIKDIDRESLYDSTNRLVEERFYRNDFMYRRITYKGTVGIIEFYVSEGIEFQTVRRMDLYPVPLMMYASKNERTLEFVDVENKSNSAHLFHEYENSENGYTIEYIYLENGKLLRVSHIYNDGRRKVVATYDETGRTIYCNDEYNKSEVRLNCTQNNYLLESIELRELNGNSEKWAYAIMEYFNGKDRRFEIVERKRFPKTPIL